MVKLFKTDEQNEIIRDVRFSDGNLVVFAGPGCAKTTTLQMTCEELDAKFEDLVMVIAYNNAIIDEIKTKIGNAKAFTMHKLGLAILRANGLRRFSIKEDKYFWLLRDCISKDYENSPLSWRITNDCNAILEKCLLWNVNFSTPQEILEVAARYGLRCENEYVNYIIQGYQEGMKQYSKDGIISLDDMIFLPVHLNMQAKRGMYVGNKKYNGKLNCKYLLVDETQDFSPVHHQILDIVISATNCKLVAVGDKLQSMYGFAGALPSGIDDMVEKYSANVLPLSTTFRLPSNHVEFVNNLYGTNLQTPNNSGVLETFSVDQMISEVKPGDVIVVRNINGKSSALGVYLELLLKGIPVRLEGFNVLKMFETFLKDIEKWESDFWNNTAGYCEMYFEEKRVYFARTFSASQSSKKVEELDRTIKTFNAYLNVFPSWSSEQFLKKLKATIYGNRGKCVILSTVHRFKGLENDRIFVLDYNLMCAKLDGLQDWEKQEELNIRYVALTRAKREMYLVNSREE